MATNLTVTLDDRAGALADLGEATGKAGINIEGVCGYTTGGKGTIHLLVSDGAAARKAIEGAGFTVSEREVEVVDIGDKPGALGELARKLADSGKNLDLAYLATGTRLVVGTA